MKKSLIVTLALLLAAGQTFAARPTENALSKIVTNIAGRFTLSGYAMAGWEYHDTADPNNEFKVNKIIMMGNMRILDNWNAFIMFDFKGGTLHEYWTSYSVRPWFNIKLGQFKTPFSIENPISPAALELLTQTSLATNYMIIGASPTMMPGGAGRDLGLTIYGTAWHGRLSYDLAVMNGEGRNRSDRNSTKDIAVRLTLRPVKHLSVSISGIHGRGRLADGVAPWVPGVNEKGDFRRQRLAVGATLFVPHFHARAEYMWGRDGRGAGDVSRGAYATFAATDIGTPGLDFVAGYDHLEPQADPTVNRWQAGVQYWFYPKCRIQLAYMNTHTHQAAPHPTESAILTQLQVAF